MLATLASGCQNQAGTSTDDSTYTTVQDQTTEEESTEEESPLLVLIDADGKANCTIVKPTQCSETVADAIDYFVLLVEIDTGVKLPVADETAQTETPYEIVVNATANRSFVETQRKRTGYTDYVVGIWERHILLTFHSDWLVKQALERLYDAFEKTEEGYCVRSDTDIRVSTMLGDKKTSVPSYDTTSGTVLPFYSVKDGYEVCIQNTSRTEADAYRKKLLEYGFSKYSENAVGENITCVYVAEDLQVFVNYDASQNTVRIVFSDPGELPSLEKPVITALDDAQMSIAQIGVGGLGMSYAIQLKDYSFILIDGGTGAADNVNMLYNYMVDKTPEGAKPRIACWIFTHADPDHIGAPQEFLKKYSSQVDLETVMWNFPDCSIQNTSQSDEKIGASISELENQVKKVVGVKTYTAHTGQRFYFKGVEIEVLFTEEDLYPRMPANYNDTSLMMRFVFESGKTFMILADSTHYTSKQLAASYGVYLKSDILQLAHHGLIGGDKQLYEYIDPAICFWATSQQRYEGKYDTNKDGKVTAEDVQHCLGQGKCDYNEYIRDDSVRVRTHYHGSQTFVITVD